jgi:hypothetical protein
MLAPSVTAAAIKLWDAYCCPRSRGIGQNRGEIAMKTILSALVALSVIAGVTVFEQIDPIITNARRRRGIDFANEVRKRRQVSLFSRLLAQGLPG